MVNTDNAVQFIKDWNDSLKTDNNFIQSIKHTYIKSEDKIEMGISGFSSDIPYYANFYIDNKKSCKFDKCKIFHIDIPIIVNKDYLHKLNHSRYLYTINLQSLVLWKNDYSENEEKIPFDNRIILPSPYITEPEVADYIDTIGVRDDSNRLNIVFKLPKDYIVQTHLYVLVQADEIKE